MPRIAQYNAPTEALAESTRGTQAWEQAGRRLGPLYNETAQFQKEQGTAVAQGIKQLTWPYDIARLRMAQTSAGGVSFRVTEPKTGTTPSHNAVGQISRGAGALGPALSDGGYRLAADKPSENMTLEEGNLVTASQARKYADAINAGLDKDRSAYLDELVKTRDYWTKYNTGSAYTTDTSDASSRGPEAYTGAVPPPPMPAAPVEDTGSSWGSLSSWVGAASTAGMDQSGQF